jgi:hypothetical protein
MTDLNDLRKRSQTRGRRNDGLCKAGRLINTLHPSTKKVVKEAMDDPVITNPVIVDWLLEDYGIQIKSNTFSIHRTGNCSCAKED